MTALPAPIEGVSFRHFAGEADFVGMIAMLQAQARHDGVDRHDSVDDLANSYRNLTNCDLDTDLAIAEMAGEIVGYARVAWWIEEATGDRVLVFIEWVHPDVNDLGVEPALIGWSESRLLDIACGRPYDGADVLQTWADEVERSKVDALADAGFGISQTYETMTRSLTEPIPDCPLPTGLEFRAVSHADRRKVWEADQEAFRDHVGHTPGTEADFQAFVGTPHFDPALWVVAFHGDEIAGQVLNFIDEGENTEFDRKRGWTEWISVQRAWRKQGVAKAAIAASMRMLRRLGMEEAALGVHTTNPTGAYQLYQGLGYRVTQRSHEWRKPAVRP